MLWGKYRDVVQDSQGCPAFDSGWTFNTIVTSASLVIAGLLKNDRKLRGIQFYAVGAGHPEWDQNPVTVDPEASRLQNEIQRLRLSHEQIIYLDTNGAEVTKPTTQIEIRASFTWPETDQILREFGLFGGNASKAKNSGYLINYVVHPRIELEASATLTRCLRLSFRPMADTEWLETPQHWLGDSPVKDIDGVGGVYAAALADVGIRTIGGLASTEPMTLKADLPLMKLFELRAKARLTLRAVANLSPVSGLLDRSAWEVIVTPTATLAADSGASEEAVACLREQVSALQLALDNRYLQQVAIGELAQP